MQNEAVLWDVVQEHLDEAEFLLQQWSAATHSPKLSAADVQRTIERRLMAHVDGLLVGGDEVAARLLWPVMEEDSEASQSLVAAAGLALLMGARPTSTAGAPSRNRLLDVLRNSSNQAVRAGLVAAHQVAPRSHGYDDDALRLALYATDSAPAQAAFLAILASWQTDPGPILGTLLEHPDPHVVCAALHAAVFSSDRHRIRHAVEECLTHDDAAVRAAAIRTGIVWNVARAWRACGEEARAGVPDAMLFLALVGGTEAVGQLTSALGTAAKRNPALFALGFTGSVDAVEVCLPFLDDPDVVVAKLAVEAIASITGLPLYEDGFFVTAPEGPDAELPPLEEDLRTDLMPLPHDDLPVPHAPNVRQWWSERKKSFLRDTRYLQGLALSPEAMGEALTRGPLRRTRPLVSEIAIRSGGRVQLGAFHLAQTPPSLGREVSLERKPIWQ